jgi:hypothetical protein
MVPSSQGPGTRPMPGIHASHIARVSNDSQDLSSDRQAFAPTTGRTANDDMHSKNGGQAQRLKIEGLPKNPRRDDNVGCGLPRR